MLRRKRSGQVPSASKNAKAAKTVNSLGSHGIPPLLLPNNLPTMCTTPSTSSTSSGDISRRCPACFALSPVQRYVHTTCGHVFCNACEEHISFTAVANDEQPVCLFCNSQGELRPLEERVLGNEIASQFFDEAIQKANYEKQAIKSAVNEVHSAIAYFSMALDKKNAEAKVSAAIFEAVDRSAKHRLNMRKDNKECESLPLRYSRLCLVCSNASPVTRVFFKVCSHDVCDRCANLVKGVCPLCGTPSQFIVILE